MKTLIAFLLLMLPCTMKGQELFNFVYDNAKRTVENPNSGFMMTRIAQFKYTALNYMKDKAFETRTEVPEEFLNTQAYYLSEFITLFFEKVTAAPKSGKRNSKKNQKESLKMVALFMDASGSNPLFNDPDEETTKSYIIEGTEITPFSLDTDWEKAYIAVTTVLKAQE